MKIVSIELSDQDAAAIEAEILGGGHASVSEVLRAALHDYLDCSWQPSEPQMLADFATAEAELAAGGRLYAAEEARRHIRGGHRD